MPSKEATRAPDEPKTVDGVLFAMRRYADIVEAVEADISKEVATLLREYADRIEKTHKREIEEWEAVARVQDKAQTALSEEIDRLRGALEKCADIATQVRMPIGGVADSSRCPSIAKIARDALGETAQEAAR